MEKKKTLKNQIVEIEWNLNHSLFSTRLFL